VGISVTATVTNTGLVTSDEVVQLYGSFQGSGAVSAPLQQLLSFERLMNIASGENRQIEFPLFSEQFQLVGLDNQLSILPGEWKLYLGGGPPSNAKYGGGQVLIGSVLFE
jgi:beta-glucosidase